VAPASSGFGKTGQERDVRGMDQLTAGIGAAWIVLTLVAATFLGTEFVLHEILTVVRRRRSPELE